jgi:hypothetical protein
MKFLAAALLVAWGIWATGVQADDTSDAVKCLAVGLSMSSSDDPNDQTLGMLSTMYWMGRVDGLTPRPDLEKLMQAGAFDMKPEEQKAEAARCHAALTARGEALTLLGQHLRQRQNSN